MNRITATLTYIRKDQQTLMLHRNKRQADFHKGKYNGIGGKLEAGESPEACARREIYEETGLRASRLTYRGHLTFPLFDGINDWICFVYECTMFTGTLRECDEGTLHWIDDSEIFNLNLWEGDVHFLEVLYQTKSLFNGTFWYIDKQLHHYELLCDTW